LSTLSVEIVARTQNPLSSQDELTQILSGECEWRNSPLKSPFSLIKWRISCFYHTKCNKNNFKQRKCASKWSN